jgi:hypothetical protein
MGEGVEEVEGLSLGMWHCDAGKVVPNVLTHYVTLLLEYNQSIPLHSVTYRHSLVAIHRHQHCCEYLKSDTGEVQSFPPFTHEGPNTYVLFHYVEFIYL